MRNILAIVLAVAFAGLCAPAALCQEAAEGTASGGKLASLDKDNDGLISKEEWPGRPEGFDRLDTNGDGKLDAVELAAGREKAREIREEVQERRREGERREGERREGESERIRERARGAAMFAMALFATIDTDKDGRMSSAEIDDFAAKIKAADLDKDGYVTKEEAREHIRQQMAKRLSDRLMEKFDANKDGKIERSEFPGDDERFKRFDVNGDGSITVDDFLAYKPRARREAKEESAEKEPAAKE